MIYKFTSSKKIVAKVFSDLDIKEGANRVSDIIEWIGEAVEKIGSVRQLKRIVSGIDGAPILELKNNQCRLPNDMFRLNQVLYSTSESGPWFPVKLSTGNLNTWSSSTPYTDNGFAISDNDSIINAVKILYGKYVEDPVYSWFSKMDYKTALDILNTNENARVLLTNLIRLANKEESVDICNIKYSIKPGYINTNVPNGFIKISYDALPVDEDGYPLIPDLASYMEAIYWYISMKLAYPEYRAGRMRQDIYYDSRRSWNFYCKQAYGESMMPNEDEMESIKNSWIRLVPNLNSHNEMYSDLADQQIIYNK